MIVVDSVAFQTRLWITWRKGAIPILEGWFEMELPASFVQMDGTKLRPFFHKLKVPINEGSSANELTLFLK